MLKYQLDNIVKQDKDFVAYIHIINGEKIIQTTSLIFRDKEDFKKVLKMKTAKIKAEYDEKEIKKAEIEQALKEIA